MSISYLVQVDDLSRFRLAAGNGFIILAASTPDNLSGGGPPKKRRPTLRLDERYRPEIIDPREFARPKRVARAPEHTPADQPDIAEPAFEPPELPVVARMPDDLAAKVEAAISVAERKRALAELAADDEDAILAIIFAAMR